jgi:transcriptional regulator with XRE-family HTH domain
MSEQTTMGQRIRQLRGDMSLQEFSKAIQQKTGKPISVSGLHHLESGGRLGRHATMETLAEYAGKPMSWFYSTDEQPATVSEARADYLISTGDPTIDRYKQEILAQVEAINLDNGHQMTVEDLRRLSEVIRVYLSTKSNGK